MRLKVLTAVLLKIQFF